MVRLSKVIGIALLGLLLGGCSPKKESLRTYEQHLVFPEAMSQEGRVDMASRLVPSPQQLAWQQLELTAFIHFGINTFTDREWGDGQEDPRLFRPTALDTDQWCRVLSEAGFRMVILTAKHHDGFCLWQTKTTEHSVASSSWKEGKGDVVADLAKSCDKYGLKLGLYLSPWDRNHPTYGEGEAYNEVYLEQLRELLTHYGRVDEVWFDGANGEGPNGKKQEYDWQAVTSLIKELQPDAITAIMGKDVRWVGNERGLGRETEWSATVLPPGSLLDASSIKDSLGIEETSADLGSREMLAKASELFWYPSEVDVSIRPGWFYHQTEHPKSLEHLANIYFSSVGMNSSLLLNIPPNTEGLLAEEDVVRIGELGRFIREFTAHDAVRHFTPLKLEAGEYAELEIDPEETISAIVIQEDIRQGQRVECFEVEAFVANSWVNVGRGTTVGYKRIILTKSPLRTSRLRFKLIESRGTAHITHIGAHLVPEIVSGGDASEIKVIAKDAWKPMPSNALAVDLGKSTTVNGFVYTPKGCGDEVITHFELSISSDGKHWERIESGEFGNIVNNPIAQYYKIRKPVTIRFVQLTGTNQDRADTVASVDEFDIF